jgi:hypothetical protein
MEKMNKQYSKPMVDIADKTTCQDNGVKIIVNNPIIDIIAKKNRELIVLILILLF